jgi:hypothetical protein
MIRFTKRTILGPASGVKLVGVMPSDANLKDIKKWVFLTVTTGTAYLPSCLLPKRFSPSMLIGSKRPLVEFYPKGTLLFSFGGLRLGGLL